MRRRKPWRVVIVHPSPLQRRLPMAVHHLAGSNHRSLRPRSTLGAASRLFEFSAVPGYL
jgi:hypothetical protein